MIKYRFYACKHLTSDILQRTYLNQEKTYDFLSTFKSREKQNNKHNIYVFKKSKGGNRKVPFSIFLWFCVYFLPMNIKVILYEKTQLFNILDRPFQPDLKTNNC